MFNTQENFKKIQDKKKQRNVWYGNSLLATYKLRK